MRHFEGSPSSTHVLIHPPTHVYEFIASHQLHMKESFPFFATLPKRGRRIFISTHTSEFFVWSLCTERMPEERSLKEEDLGQHNHSVAVLAAINIYHSYLWAVAILIKDSGNGKEEDEKAYQTYRGVKTNVPS